MLIAKSLRGWQMGLESTSAQGTPVASNRAFKNGNFKPIKRRNNVRKVMSEGHKSASSQSRGKKNGEWSVAGQIGYNIMPYWAAMLYSAAAGAAPSTIATGAYQYSMTMASTTVDTPQTVTFEYGNNQGSNSRMAFGTCSDFNYKVSEAGCDYTASGFGAYPTKNITLTPSPTLIPQQTAHFTDFRVNYSNTFSGLSSGKLLTGVEVEFDVKNKYRSKFFIDDATSSIGGIMERQPDITGTITAAEGSESDLFLAQLESSTLGYLQLQATGPLLVSGTPNYYASIKYTMAMFVDDEEETDNNDLYAGKYTFYSGEDTINGDVNLTTVNGLSSL